MKIEKLSNKIEFDVEAQKLDCMFDCPAGVIWVGNTAYVDKDNIPGNCKLRILYTSFLSKKN